MPKVNDLMATLGAQVDVTLPEAAGGDGPMVYSATGLPEGLFLDRVGRRVLGQPTSLQSVRVTYYVTDADGDLHRRSFTWTVVGSDSGPSASNRAPVVSMAHESLAIQPGVPVLLNARAHDPDGDDLTYEWSVMPDIGTLVEAFPASPSWFPPLDAGSTQVVSVTLTVRDGRGGVTSASMGITVLPSEEANQAPAGQIERLEYAMERMLASPSQFDPSVIVEDRNPWLRQAWDFATKSGRYEGLEYEFEIVFGEGIPIVELECYPVELGEHLGRCTPSGLLFPRLCSTTTT